MWPAAGLSLLRPAQHSPVLAARRADAPHLERARAVKGLRRDRSAAAGLAPASCRDVEYYKKAGPRPRARAQLCAAGVSIRDALKELQQDAGFMCDSCLVRRDGLAVGAGARREPVIKKIADRNVKDMGEHKSLPAVMRLTPRSYFCICWNVTPIAWPRLLWDMPSAKRRTRMRDPTCTSIRCGLSLRAPAAGDPCIHPPFFGEYCVPRSRMAIITSR